jgi:hypothetical protein
MGVRGPGIRDPRAEGQDMVIAAIVTSARVRAGKTLLARLLAENFFLSGDRPALLDTDTTEKRLWSFFRAEAGVFDLDKVPDQMALFDALSVGASHTRIVEVAHRSAKKFFELMRDTDYIAEARVNQVEPVIFYIPSPDPDSYEYGRKLLEQFPDTPFVVVQNDHLGDVKYLTRLSVGYRALETVHRKLAIPALDPLYIQEIDDPSFSFREFMRASTYDLPPAANEAIKNWLVRCLRNTYAATETLRGGTVAAGSTGRDI